MITPLTIHIRMLKLILHQFQRYDDYEIEFPESQLNLVKGVHGAGKSTLFRAIQWCLYGELKKVAPKDTPKAKTTVSIIMGDVVVTRSKVPNLLVVESDKKLHGEEAQAYINSIFGASVCFNAVSYIKQLDQCTLLTGNPATRMEILNEIAFPGANPEVVLDRISNFIKDLELKRSMCMEKLRRAEKVHNHMFPEPITIPENLNQETIDSMKSELSIKLAETKKLLKLYDEQKITDSRKAELNKSILNDEASLKKYKQELNIANYDEEYLTKIAIENREKIVNASQNIKNRRTWDELNASLNSLPPSLDLTYTKDNYDLAKSIEDNYYYWNRRCIDGGLDYDQGELNKYKEKLVESAKIYKASQEELHKLIPLAKALTELNSLPEDTVIVNLQELRTQIDDMKRSLDVHTCPHCSKGVRFINGILAKAETLPVSKQELTKKEQYYKEAQKRSEIQVRRDSLKKIVGKDTLIEVNARVKQLQSIKAADPRVTELLSVVKVYTLPIVSSHQIALQLTRQDIQTKLALWKVPPPDVTSGDIKQWSKQLEFIPRYIDSCNRIKGYKKDIEGLKNNINAEVNYTSIVKETNTLRETIKSTENALKYQISYTELEAVREEHSLLEDKKKDAEELYAIAIDIECTQLALVVDSINTIANDIACKLFDEPVTIKLNLLSTSKTTGRTKQQVNVKITLRGNEYEMCELSGGEMYDVTMSLMMALNITSSSPLALLDESMAMLNSEARVNNLNILRDLFSAQAGSSGRYLICISHDDGNGDYDNVFEITKQ